MRITGLAIPYGTPSNQDTPHAFIEGSIGAFATVPIPVVAGHKTTPHIIGAVVAFEDTEDGLVATADVPDDLDLTGLAWSAEVTPWTMALDADGVQIIELCTLHRLSLTRQPAFEETTVEVVEG